ncbi:GPW/gp25 family protein [Tropicimonas sp. TH_r6]|uniref:GPW/gp25 family protein n=1 Tax=Tropicimonas sp. TH_r6 TaxID=3082085 RepID=UPI0029534956|nr:GPW/gp25 family protein [Tropicimonas sp. TH_r6]MDV7144029.1 GPW/gp25 family protein [Tropicimonas sp. TH_r6]
MGIEDPFIGQGWSFPPRFEAGEVEVTGGQHSITESLRVIVGTGLGERLMRPDFGCAMDGEVFGLMNTSRITWIENVVRQAILLHEPRIDAKAVNVTSDGPEGRLMVEVIYEVRGTNSRFNVVFPFYLEAET